MATKTIEDYKFGAAIINEDAYKADLTALDRYLAFTAEILRLSLLAIAAEVTYLQTVFGTKANGIDFTIIQYKWIYLASLILFTLAAGFSLLHRFQATDGFTCHLEYLRAIEKNDEERIIKEANSRNFQYDLAGYAMIASCWTLGLGVVSFVITILLHFLMS